MNPPPTDFESQLKRHGRALRALAAQLVSDANVADDVVQDVWLAALQRPPRHQGSVSGWLATALHNVVRLWRRKERRRVAHEQAFAALAVPERSAASREQAHELLHAVETLEPVYRDVVWQRYFEGRPPRAIAAASGVPVATIKSRLQRGLGMLRDRLAAGDVERGRDWRGALAVAFGLREGTAATGGVVGLMAGGVLMATWTKVLAVAAAAALAAVLWWPAGAEPVPAGLGRSDAPAAAVAAALPSEREAPAAAAADGGAKAEPAADTASARVPAWLARFLVVGEDDRPVADAVVTVWSPKRVKHEVKHDAAMQKAMGIEGNAYSGHGPTPLLELHTDVQGHAQATFELECVTVSASKGDLTTGEYMLGHTRAAKQEMKLVLETPLVVRGIVLHSDGRPAAGARVVAYVNGGSILQRGRAQMPKPIATGSDGRFELPVRAHVGYGVRGELGGAKTFSERVRIHPPQQVDELVLCFPGGITLEGIVVDASGKPVAKAEVTAWREYHPEQRNPLDSERGDAKSGDDGRFSIPVRRHARYQLVASEGVYANSTATWIETSPAQPHADVRLVLLQFAAIQGRVVHGDGAPFPGVRVSALPGIVETSHGIGMPTLRDRFGAVKDVTTGDDGGFALLVHPTVTWTVRALPVPEHRALVFEQRGIAAGRDDVELRIGDRELAGCTVHGTVTRSGGQPVGPFDVQVYAWEDDKSEHFDAVDARARIDGDAFTLSALPLGRRFALVVRPRSGDGPGDRNELLAPAQTGPFLTDRAELEVDVRVEEWAWLSVKVLNDQGLPARSVRLSARREPQVGPPIAGGQVDADGGNTLWCAPGLHRLQVWTLRDKLTDQEVVVTSGINPDIVVRLPAGR